MLLPPLILDIVMMDLKSGIKHLQSSSYMEIHENNFLSCSAKSILSCDSLCFAHMKLLWPLVYVSDVGSDV